MQYMYTSQKATYCGNLQGMVLVLSKAHAGAMGTTATDLLCKSITYALKLSHTYSA